MPRLRKRPTHRVQTLQIAAVQAFRSRACRLGFLAGFAAGCLGVVASLDPQTHDGADLRAEVRAPLARTP